MMTRRVASLALAALVVLTGALALPSAAAAKAKKTKERHPVVDSIKFDGNDHVRADSLLARMETSSGGFLWFRHKLDSFTLGQDLVNLEVYYQDLGFLTAQARTQKLNYDRDSSHVAIGIKINEGPQWILDSLDFRGNSRITDAELRKSVRFTVGAGFSPLRVLDGRDRIIDDYVNHSFLDTKVEDATVRDDQNHKARVTYNITEGRPAYIRDVRITGLTKTDTSVVRRELTLKKGHLLRVRDVARSQSNLYTTGLFRSVYIFPDTSSIGDSLKDVTVAVVERRTGQMSAGIGFSTEDRLRVTTEIRHRNLLGQNLEAGFEGTVSRRRNAAAVAFSQPWSFGVRFRINENAGFTHINQPAFASDGVNFGLGILKPVYPYWRIEGGYNWSRTIILRQPKDLESTRLTRVSRVSLIGTYETRDDLLNTYRGYYARLQADQAGTLLGGTARFLRGDSDQRYFTKLGDVVVGLHMGLGAMRQQSADIPIPVTERYFAGGQGTIRGFREQSLGPKDVKGNPAGGVERAFLQTEARIPLFWIVGTAVFVDAGMLAARPPGLAFKETAAGAGLGLRLRSPIGIVRVDAAWPLTKTDANGVQFTFGTSQEF